MTTTHSLTRPQRRDLVHALRVERSRTGAGVDSDLHTAILALTATLQTPGRVAVALPASIVPQ